MSLSGLIRARRKKDVFASAPNAKWARMNGYGIAADESLPSACWVELFKTKAIKSPPQPAGPPPEMKKSISDLLGKECGADIAAEVKIAAMLASKDERENMTTSDADSKGDSKATLESNMDF